ncbi:MAG TPA: acetylxylan esterase [Verrucomicrobiae bacterium]|nr:acetylxylan esterase [Verrucomicrobiae bacterium]
MKQDRPFTAWELISLILVLLSTNLLGAQVTPADQDLAEYFKAETGRISAACLSNIQSLAEWKARRPEFRRQAAEMLGLDPMPERAALNPVITGKLEQEAFSVEKLYFQSRPHLYVTANLYLPKHSSKPAPAVLYLCGHSPVITNGISCGNKTAYQQHGIWFARHGYACLVLDTLQWGEILGHHQGTYHEGMWWWNARGYTPAGVETWNAIRALDYLISRPEVDPERIGVTGRSGGGAYSWFLAALDDRVKVVAPVAGITDLRNYVVDGTVEDHCDCMFLVNTWRWDYPLLAALCAPRPLLLSNSDADTLFPLDGIMRTRDKVKKIYDLYGASTNFGLVIAPGPHKDTQELQVPVFRWFNFHLKHEDPLIETAAVKMFPPGQLRVFDKIPDDQINTQVQDSFVPAAQVPTFPDSAEAWKQMRDAWMKDLREKCFAGWPADSGPPRVTRLFSEKAAGIQYEAYEIQAQENVPLRIYLMRRVGGSKPRQIVVRVAGSSFTNAIVDASASLSPAILETMSVFGTEEVVKGLTQEIKDKAVMQAVFLPRGVGPTAWSGGSKRLTQLRRRFMLVGQTLDGMRVWDICRAVQALHCLKEFRQTPVALEAEGDMGVNALYASLFEPGISALNLRHIPSSHAEGPDYLNVLKYLDIPQAAAMAAERCRLRLRLDDMEGWDFLRSAAASPVANLKLEFLK